MAHLVGHLIQLLKRNAGSSARTFNPGDKLAVSCFQPLPCLMAFADHLEYLNEGNRNADGRSDFKCKGFSFTGGGGHAGFQPLYVAGGIVNLC